MNPIPSPSGFSAKYEGNIIDISLENFDLELKYLSAEERELLKQFRNKPIELKNNKSLK